MAKKNETLAIVLALLATLGLLGIAIGLLLPMFRPDDRSDSLVEKPLLPPNARTDRTPPEAVRFSGGEKSLLAAVQTPDKQAGIAAYAADDYDLAAEKFAASLRTSPNDPEALIYQQNAIAAASSNLTIGASLPIGPAEKDALEMMRGIAQAQWEINEAGGINGQKLVVVLADDQNDPQVAQQVAKGFGQEERVLGVIGSFSSGVSMGAVEAYKSEELIHISPTSTAVALSGASPYFFRTVPSDYVAARALAEYAYNDLQRERAIVYFNSGSDYSKSLKGEFSTSLLARGGEIVTEVDLSAKDFDPEQSLETAEADQANVIALFSNSGTRPQGLDVINANRSQLPIVAGDSLFSAETLEGAGAYSQDMTIAIPWQIDASPNPEFPVTSGNLWNATVNWRTAMSYDAVQAIAQALRSGDPSREGLKSALSTKSFQATGASGEISFLPSGDRNASVQLVTVEPGGGPGGYVFTPVR